LGRQVVSAAPVPSSSSVPVDKTATPPLDLAQRVPDDALTRRVIGVWWGSGRTD
jgi:hypothetical protein